MTPEQITEARRLLNVSTADISGTATDEEIDRHLHERTVAERTFMMNMALPLLAEVERLQDDQHMHMNVRLEVEKILDGALGPEEEDGAGGGLAADVALLADKLQRVKNLHREYKIFGECGHEHEEHEDGVYNVIEVGVVCEKGYHYSICHECCVDAQGFQTEECIGEHMHLNALCPTRAALDNVEVTV